MEFSTANFSSPLPEIPGMAEPLPVAPRTPEAAPAAASMDFDLSDITLELDLAETKPAPAPEINFDNLQGIQAAQDDNVADYSNNAEMSTKLDLAVAYQEIGDKEGARELLDEVVKGGTPEQSDKAKSLLSKLA
jgi:pilus assembly protein FimV